MIGIFEKEISEASRCPVAHIIYILIWIAFAVLALLCERWVILILLLEKALRCAVFAIEMACDSCFICAIIAKRTTIKAAGSYLRLIEALAIELYFLGAGLS